MGVAQTHWSVGGIKTAARQRFACANLAYEQLPREILKEAAAVDAAEDERYGDELHEHLQTSQGRRAALQEAKRKLERDRAQGSTDSETAAGEEHPL